ncbi:hypothetical protein GGX14DRAFT_553602 [Mycena pura]|uniref:Uncharacterized protein n=1 Tax=Mycena pura TaxID=153505 RepID=A0AAD6YUX5_9AGAR|nr:hypothetical protein GGX14DRAFT_553602 [Mycena pura]
MAGRARREASDARPGEILTNNAQKRRTREQIDDDTRAEEKAKEDLALKTAKKKKSSVKKVAAVEDRLRQEDTHRRASASRPDLVTAALQRRAGVPSNDSVTNPPTTDMDVAMDVDENEDDAEKSVYDDQDASEDSDEYVDIDSGNEGNAAGSDDDVDGEDDDEEIKEEIAKFAAQVRARNKKSIARSNKQMQKGKLRNEIQEAAKVKPLKRKIIASSSGLGSGEDTPVVKKPKAALGGLKTNWHKDVGVPKPVKKSATKAGVTEDHVSLLRMDGVYLTWKRRAVSHAPSETTSSTSVTHPSSMSDGGTVGEFDNDEETSNMQAEVPVKKRTGAMTARGITLKKDVLVDVAQGKTKKEPKPKFTNSDLPFPADNFRKDLVFFQGNSIPRILAWAATHRDPFSAGNDPKFKPVVKDTWDDHFPSPDYVIDDSVYAVCYNALFNFRSKLGKRGLSVVSAAIKTKKLKDAAETRQWVADQLKGLAFIYENTETEPPSGSFRSDLVSKTFAEYVRVVSKIDVEYGRPVGALSLSAAAVERGLQLWEHGTLSEDGVSRGRQKTLYGFIAVPWAQRASKYLTSIDRLTEQKWSKVIERAGSFVGELGNNVLTDPVSASDEESGDSSIDPRTEIVISDDDDE